MRARHQNLGFLFCFLVVTVLAFTPGCSEDTSPVETTADELDQFLAENPDEAYTSDDLSEEMDEDEDSE